MQMLPKQYRLMEVTCLLDAVFDAAYLLLNLYIRWGVEVDSGSISTMSFFLFPLFGLYSRISAYTKIQKSKRASAIVVEVKQPEMEAPARARLAKGLRQAEKWEDVEAIIELERENKITEWLMRIIGIVLSVVSGTIMVKLFNDAYVIESSCRVEYGALWKA